MTNSEALQFVGLYRQFYPVRDTEVRNKAAAFALAFEAQSYEDAKAALKAFAQSDTKGYAPTIGQLMERMPQRKTEPMWGNVTRADIERSQQDMLELRRLLADVEVTTHA